MMRRGGLVLKGARELTCSALARVLYATTKPPSESAIESISPNCWSEGKIGTVSARQLR